MTLKAKLLTGCLILILAPGGGGMFAWRLQHRLGDLAIAIYDSAVIGVSYIGKAQADFIRYAGAPATNAKRLATIVNNLNVASERASTVRARAVSDSVRDKINALQRTGEAGTPDQIAEIGGLLDKAVRQFDTDGLAARDAAEEAVGQSRDTLRYIGFSVIGIVAGIGLILWRAIIPPLRRAVSIATAIAAGKLDNAIDVRGRSETASLLRALATMQGAIAENIARIEAQRLADQEQQTRFTTTLTATLRDMADKVENETTASMDVVGHHTRAMADSAGAMELSAASTEASTQAAMLAAKQALGNTEMVASAAEQLTASIREISSQVNQSAAVVGQAVAGGGATKEAIASLSEKVDRIGAVADIIARIASQTNLLALNATIEAARAGAAGKGFAVVASEVKELAVQTARSTDEITRHIADVRSATDLSIQAVGSIVGTVEEVNAIAGSIAAAVEQQAAATGEIARNVSESVMAVNEMTARIGDVTREAGHTGRAATEVRESAAGLTASMADLKRAVVSVIRTATPQVNRRRSERHPANLACRVSFGGMVPIETRTIDLSDDGARIVCDIRIPADTEGTLRVASIAEPLPFVVKRIDPDGLGLQLRLTDSQQSVWRTLIESLTVRAA